MSETKHTPGPTLYDVVAVNLETKQVRIFDRNKSFRNAEAIVMMAVSRRGCDEEFYSETAPGLYQEGDVWKGNGLPE